MTAHLEARTTTGGDPVDPDIVRLRAEGVELGYGDRTIVENLDLDVLPGRVTTVIGPNGCGKSTVLRALGRLLPTRSGQVLLDGRRIDRTPTKEVARVLGVLPQSPLAPEGLTVGDLVARGRHPHQAWYRQWSGDDERAVADSLAWTGLSDLADRPVDELSGGQRQRAWISMALAQETDLLLLDEPTTFLDLAHQVDVLELVRRLQSEAGRTVVMVLHDLNLAARYADRLIAMKDGRIVATGTPAEVITEELLAEVFGLRARVLPDPVTGTPLVVPDVGPSLHAPAPVAQH
ncbi:MULTISPECIES: ABC transporter ATP-binding protein [Pseudonocardia]|uniref:Cobalamin/Fe3+-siderophore ABC transporter ATP-binding protein n=2 Tax=Pseudonocardia TaxID=1847 RepID=A0ABQ0RWV1_9PSEU|nr:MULTISPECIES: ABC transporter ATP-binding protein [Pseudonocardia]OSY40440.1 putative siderophore transport system ATP-binding protein YusV [Pseudonocardia autotrophica]TDN72231.1 iron complex transport system ATP-binding protein [Pseudonocardia autotrophica]BBG02940.1 cobalamin/Fe3+-siderophore ABC transporter ATP-binding protein [Pseudonocardia autotrophica]GEC25158.1 cobalamin/Fe3+-siderophore ABC transporter ATP-binding protein [Pseudonocardia saturnea]